MAEPIFATTDRSRLDAAIVHGPAHYRPIWLAVRDAGCGYMIVPQRAGRFDVPTGKPLIAVIGDDMHEALGPAAFHRASIERLLKSVRAVSIVASEPIVLAYAGPASAAAGLGYNAAIIETLPHRQAEWESLVRQHAPDAALIIAAVQPEGSAR